MRSKYNLGDKRGYACIGLDNPKSEINVGAAMRAVGVYAAKGLYVTGSRYKPGRTDTMKHYRQIPLIHTIDLHSVIPFDCVPVAVDLVDGAIPLPEYHHPVRAFYIFGAEDATLGDRILSWCRDIIYVPTNGCMNLAAAVNVILYDRLQKSQIVTNMEVQDEKQIQSRG